MDCLDVRPQRERALSLVTVHGFLGDGRSLERVSALVRDRFVRCTSLVIPGHASERFDPEWQWNDTVRMLNERLAGEDNVIVGYSMGARLALSMLLDAPRRFAGAVLVGVDAGIDDPRERAQRQRWERSMSDKILTQGLDAFVREWQTLPVFASQRALPEAIRDELRVRRSQHDPAGVAWAMTALGTGSMPSRWSELASIEVPVVLVTGALDEKFSAIAARMVQRNPRWILHRIAPSVGHDVTIEAPDFVASAVERIRREVRTE
jgi:2-succinyl-6-hydroxy-2,4-cyclohexadiene-1-carboxylate synthase